MYKKGLNVILICKCSHPLFLRAYSHFDVHILFFECLWYNMLEFVVSFKCFYHSILFKNVYSNSFLVIFSQKTTVYIFNNKVSIARRCKNLCVSLNAVQLGSGADTSCCETDKCNRAPAGMQASVPFTLVLLTVSTWWMNKMTGFLS